MSKSDQKKDSVNDVTNEVDDDTRPWIAERVVNHQFYAGDEVNLLGDDGSIDGPFMIASFRKGNRVTLSHLDGSPALGNREFRIDMLEMA